MRITKGRIKTGCWDHYEAAYQKYVEAGSNPPGLLGRWLLRAVSNPELAFSLSLWQSQKDMETYERSDAVRQEILPHLAPYTTTDYVAHHCGVKAQKMPGGN